MINILVSKTKQKYTNSKNYFIISVLDDKCEQYWRRVNCYFEKHSDTIEYCKVLVFQDEYDREMNIKN